jgi:(p)ppGpp synthase/HD superfamily hydrolase
MPARNIELNYDYFKLCTSMRYWLLGKGWHLALKAMEMGLDAHNGERKNGNPEFSHQMFQAQYARTLGGVMYPEETLAVIFLHDIVEDHGVAVSAIHSEFGEMVGNGVDLMSDVDSQGREKPLDTYFSMMIESSAASLAKGIDRIHNFQSMLEVFNLSKQQSYIEETRNHILPMMKKARKRYTAQEPAYQNIKHVLLTQIDLIEAMHAATKITAKVSKKTTTKSST